MDTTGAIGLSSSKYWSRVLSCYVFTLLEILAVYFSLFDSLLTRWRTPVFSEEVNLLNISEGEQVLHVGCGAFPSASIMIAQLHQAKVVGIDNNPIAVKLAQICINRKQLSHLITIILGDGVEYPVDSFDVIFIAINVWPIEKVLSHLVQSMKPTARILCKASQHDIAQVLQKEEIALLFTVESQLEHPNSQSFVLRKKT
ncbi:MAG: class I SAM-dependent methyltransferase [Candidatus Thermoplasmatota archaeon]|nr:class I SAM-dependent methyltransferase [Candidatus Thermoplasmatota archaeon]